MLENRMKVVVFLFLFSLFFTGESQAYAVTYSCATGQFSEFAALKAAVVTQYDEEAIQVPTVDADNDGLDDDWEKVNKVSDPLGDEDGDGFINLIEYQENLDPHVSNSNLSDQTNFRDLLVVTPGWNLVSVPELDTPIGVVDFINNRCNPKAWLWDRIKSEYKPAENSLISSKVGYWFFAEKYAAIPMKRVPANQSISTISYSLGSHGIQSGGGPLTQNNGMASTSPVVTSNDGWKFTGWKYEQESRSSVLKAVAQYQQTFYLKLEGADGSGYYTSGTSITFTASPAPAGQKFDYWSDEASVLTDKTLASSSFTMPNRTITLTAVYKNIRYVAYDLVNGTQELFDKAPSGGWGDEFKTTKLLLRRIPKGSFTMGSPSNELGRSINETAHQVTLSQDFYMGVFEITQAQYKLITGSSSQAYFDSDIDISSYSLGEVKDRMRPMDSVSYTDIRGGTLGVSWPANNQVDADSFLGKLRAKFGQKVFDLPTEAQWEYACRAGTTAALNNGKEITSAQGTTANLGEVAWYRGNVSPYGSKVVGTKPANSLGLYDMHGNAWEWCLDWALRSYSGTATDPKGLTSGTKRLMRGGGWRAYAAYCRSAYRRTENPAKRDDNSSGLRVVLPRSSVFAN